MNHFYVEFQNKVKILIHNITENRNKQASGPVQLIPLFPLYLYWDQSCFSHVLNKNSSCLDEECSYYQQGFVTVLINAHIQIYNSD